MPWHAESGLIRSIRKWDLIAVTVNAVIGAGIFGLPSKVYSLAGSYSLVGFILCAVFAAMIVLCFAEVASRFTENWRTVSLRTRGFRTGGGLHDRLAHVDRACHRVRSEYEHPAGLCQLILARCRYWTGALRCDLRYHPDDYYDQSARRS